MSSGTLLRGPWAGGFPVDAGAKTDQQQKPNSSRRQQATKNGQQRKPKGDDGDDGEPRQQTLSINLPQSDSDWGKFHLTFVGWPRREN